MIHCIERWCHSELVFVRPVKKNDKWVNECHCLICGKNWQEEIKLEEDREEGCYAGNKNN
jgi:hypothetical protein